MSAWVLALALPVMSDDLSCRDASNDSLGEVSTVMGACVTATTPSVLLFAYENHIVFAICVSFAAVLALIVVSFLTTASSVYFFHSAFVVIVLITARLTTGDLSVFRDFGALNNLI
jgi:heme A synthase